MNEKWRARVELFFPNANKIKNMRELLLGQGGVICRLSYDRFILHNEIFFKRFELES